MTQPMRQLNQWEVIHQQIACMGMLQVMMSLEFLQKVGDEDPNAMALLQDLLRQFQERSSQVVKH